jgi:hypothetical protein
MMLYSAIKYTQLHKLLNVCGLFQQEACGMKKSLSFAMTFIAMLVFSLGALGEKPASTIVTGRHRGDQFSDEKIPSRGRVSDVYIFSDSNHICAVQMQFVFPDGHTWLSPRHGGPGGQQNSFHLDADEYIIGLSGQYNDYIDSLQIHTNKRTSPLFGGSGGTQEYSIDVDAGNQGAGFVGRSGRYLNAIGLNFVSLTITQIRQTMVFGGGGGSAFSDESVPRGARISEVRVRSGNAVNSIQAIYTLLDGRLFEGKIHGGDGGALGVFQLDPDEYVTGLSGHSGENINSIAIRTNKRTSQVFGGDGSGGIFIINVPAGKQAIGFTGRSSSYLNAIGLNHAAVERKQR